MSGDDIDPMELQKKLVLLSAASPEELRQALKNFDDSTKVAQAALTSPTTVPQTPQTVSQFSQTLSGGANIGMDPIPASQPDTSGAPVPCTGVINGAPGYCYLYAIGAPQPLPP